MASPPEPGAEASEQDGASEASRGVWSGTVDELVAILEPVATGISLCSYPDESALVMKATLDVDAACEHGALLAHLRSHQLSLCYPKRKLEQALLVLDGRHGKEWRLAESSFNDWKVAIGRRTRSLCRVVGQSEAKARPPAWCARLPWRQSVGASQDFAPLVDAAQVAPRVAATFKVGWNTELGLMPADLPASTPLTDSTPLPASTPLTDSTPLTATFANDFQSRVEQRAGRKATAVLWEAMAKDTLPKISIHQRGDRFLLLCVYEQSRQKLQIRVDRFGVLECQEPLPRGHDVLEKALKLLLGIAQKFADGLVARENLAKLRDAKLNKLETTQASSKGRGKKRKACTEPKGMAHKQLDAHPDTNHADKQVDTQPKTQQGSRSPTRSPTRSTRPCAATRVRASRCEWAPCPQLPLFATERWQLFWGVPAERQAS